MPTIDFPADPGQMVYLLFRRAGLFWRNDNNTQETYQSIHRPCYAVQTSEVAPGQYSAEVPDELPFYDWFVAAFINAGGRPGVTESDVDRNVANGTYSGSGTQEITPTPSIPAPLNPAQCNAYTYRFDGHGQPIAGFVYKYRMISPPPVTGISWSLTTWFTAPPTGADGKTVIPLYRNAKYVFLGASKTVQVSIPDVDKYAIPSIE